MRIRLFLFDRVTKFFRDVEGDFRVESLTVAAAGGAVPPGRPNRAGGGAGSASGAG